MLKETKITEEWKEEEKGNVEKPKSFEVRCGYCQGNGQVYRAFGDVTCEICKGTRQLRLPGEKSDYTSCSKCDGTGVLTPRPSDAPCDLCNCTGLLKKN